MMAEVANGIVLYVNNGRKSVIYKEDVTRKICGISMTVAQQHR
jgi:hypothetical protein